MPLAFVFICLIGAPLLSGCWGSGSAEDKSSREEAFREVIGFGPSASTTNIESSWYFMRDSYVRWIRFSADDALLDSIRRIEGARAVGIHVTFAAPGDPEKVTTRMRLLGGEAPACFRIRKSSWLIEVSRCKQIASISG